MTLDLSEREATDLTRRRDAQVAEIWRQVPGFPSYSVSNHGRVRRDLPARGATPGLILAQSNSTTGYLQVTLYANGAATKQRVHCLVALTFLGERPDGMDINHIDGVKKHNHALNLEYTTRGENNSHAYRLGLKPRTPPQARRKLTPEDVRAIRLSNDTVMSLTRQYGMSYTQIHGIRAGTSWRGVA